MPSLSRIWISERRRLALLPRLLRRVLSRKRGQHSAIARDWNDAVATERLIDAKEWADVRNIELDTEYRVALTPQVLEVVESIPFAELTETTPERRMVRLVRQAQHLARHAVATRREPRAAPLSVDFASPLRTRAYERACRLLRLYVDPRERCLTVGLPHELHDRPRLMA